MPLLDVGHRLGPTIDRMEEILHVGPENWKLVRPKQRFNGIDIVDFVLVHLRDSSPENRSLGPVDRNELPLSCGALEYALLTIDEVGPRVVRVNQAFSKFSRARDRSFLE